MKFNAGDDVTVDFDGSICPGTVMRHSNGYVMAVIAVDPETDHGSITARLDPHSTICVPEARVKITDVKAE